MKGSQTRSLLFAVALGAAIYPQYVMARLPKVPAVVVSPRSVNYERTYVGRVTPVDHVSISAKVNGEIASVEFTEGRFVEAGDVLFRLDPEPYELTLESAKAALQGAQAQHDNALITLTRSEELIKTHSISQQRLLDDQANARITKANVARSKAAVKQAELNLRYTHILAPVSGRVGERKVSVGDLAIAGGAAVTEIMVMDPVNVSLNVTERDLLDGVVEAAQLELTLANGEVYPLTGKVDFIDNHISVHSGTIKVRASFANPDNRLVPGLFANIRAIDTRSETHIIIPQQAVMESQSGRYVYTVGPENNVVVSPITTGRRIGADWVIKSGLEQGDVVLVRNLQLLRPGQNIAVQLAEDA